MDKIEVLMKIKEEHELELSKINQQINDLQEIKDKINKIENTIKVINDMIESSKLEKIVLCETYESTAYSEADYLLSNTEYYIKNNNTSSYPPEDIQVTGYLPILDNIPLDLIISMLNKYTERLYMDKEELLKSI
jgi:hypothetical protein